MRSRYDLAQNSTQRNEKTGTFYKDIFTIPVQKFAYTESYGEFAISEVDKRRPDTFITDKYGVSELDDLVFLVNNIGFIYDVEVGFEIKVPTKENLENFYFNYRI